MQPSPNLIRLSILEMITMAKSSHIGACFSCIEILWVLYFRIMHIDSKVPTWEGRDICILSKAHASAALYATLAHCGFFPLSKLTEYYQDGGLLPGHLDAKVPGVEVSLGSLGHGFPIAVGMALARKDIHHYVVVGDGECNEGSMWETFAIVGHLKLPNITLIVDCNKIQSLGSTAEVLDQSNLYKRIEAFGWDVSEVNGHDVDELMSKLKSNKAGPRAIIAHTIKGKGVSFMEDQLSWHYKSPNTEEYLQAKKEILQHA